MVSFSLQHAAHKIRAQAPLHSKKVNSAVTELALSRVGHIYIYMYIYHCSAKKMMVKLNEIHTSSHLIARFLNIIYSYVEVLMRPVVLIRFHTQAATFAAAAELVWELN